jgi:hypothetical protein
MAAPAVVHGEGDSHMAGATEVAEDVSVHGKSLGAFFLDVEQIWVAA